MDRLVVLVWLRTRMWWNGLRSRAGAADAAAAVLVAALVAAVSVGLAVGVAAMTGLALGSDDPQVQRAGLRAILWVLGFLAVIVPVILGVGTSEVPLGRLAVFPVSRGTLFRISLGGSFFRGVQLLWLPSLLAVCAVMLVSRGGRSVPAVVVLAVLAACFTVWGHALILFLQRTLQRRNLRELVVLIGFVVLVAASMAPAIFESQGFELELARFLLPESLASKMASIAGVFPPSIAAGGVASILAGKSSAALLAFAGLILWIVAGTGLGYHVFVRSLADGGGPPSLSGRTAGSERTGTRAPKDLLSVDRLAVLPPQVRAVAAKELAYLLRSTLGKFNIVMLPLFVVVVGLVVGGKVEGPVLGIDAVSMLFYGAMLYVSMFSNNVIFNSFGWEGAGVQSYFLSPLDLKSVIFGKNLGLWTLNGFLALECLLSFALIVGVPTTGTTINGLLIFAAALLGMTMAGNFVSVVFPVARDPSKFAGTASQTGMAVSFGMLAVNAVLIGALVAVPGLLGVRWLQTLLLGALVAVEVVAYGVLLGPAGRLMGVRREGLVEALKIAA